MDGLEYHTDCRVHLPRSLIGSPRVGQRGKGAGGKERGNRRESRAEGVFRNGGENEQRANCSQRDVGADEGG